MATVLGHLHSFIESSLVFFPSRKSPLYLHYYY